MQNGSQKKAAPPNWHAKFQAAVAEVAALRKENQQRADVNLRLSSDVRYWASLADMRKAILEELAKPFWRRSRLYLRIWREEEAAIIRRRKQMLDQQAALQEDGAPSGNIQGLASIRQAPPYEVDKQSPGLLQQLMGKD